MPEETVASACRECGGPMPDEVQEGQVFCSRRCSKRFHRGHGQAQRRDHGRILDVVPGCNTPAKWAWTDPVLAQQYADRVGKHVYRCRRGDRLHYHTASEPTGQRYGSPSLSD